MLKQFCCRPVRCFRSATAESVITPVQTFSTFPCRIKKNGLRCQLKVVIQHHLGIDFFKDRQPRELVLGKKRSF